MMQGPQANSCQVVSSSTTYTSFFESISYHGQNGCSVIPLLVKMSDSFVSSHVVADGARTQNPALDIRLDSRRNVTARVGRRSKVIEAPSMSPLRFSYRSGSVFGFGATTAPAPGSISVSLKSKDNDDTAYESGDEALRE